MIWLLKKNLIDLIANGLNRLEGTPDGQRLMPQRPILVLGGQLELQPSEIVQVM